MRWRRFAPAVLSLGVGAFLGAPALSQEEAKKEEPPKSESAPAEAPKPAEAAKPAAPGAPSQEEAMAAWTAYMTPGKEHEALAKAVGSWTTKTKSWMEPGAPPEETDGTSEMKMILGGRYLEQTFEGTMMGKPFSGLGYTAYDNYKKKYVLTWMDSAMTGILKMEGTYDKTGKVLTSWGLMDDPILKKAVTIKSVMRHVDDDTTKFEMYMPAANGKIFKSLEMTYTRKK